MKSGKHVEVRRPFEFWNSPGQMSGPPTAEYTDESQLCSYRMVPESFSPACFWLHLWDALPFPLPSLAVSAELEYESVPFLIAKEIIQPVPFLYEVGDHM